MCFDLIVLCIVHVWCSCGKGGRNLILKWFCIFCSCRRINVKSKSFMALWTCTNTAERCRFWFGKLRQTHESLEQWILTRMRWSVWTLRWLASKNANEQWKRFFLSRKKIIRTWNCGGFSRQGGVNYSCVSSVTDLFTWIS